MSIPLLSAKTTVVDIGVSHDMNSVGKLNGGSGLHRTIHTYTRAGLFHSCGT